MGKKSSSNPIDIHRRQERKRELKKNKAARIKARDEKVAQTRSIAEVKKEIASLEHKKSAKNGYLDSTETRTLERLNKELKIVKQALELKKKQEEEELRLLKESSSEIEVKYEHTKEGVEEKNKKRFEKTAKLSIYYDAVLNPFGAPPPGKPMLYHKRGGGVTMNLNEALLPDALKDKDNEDDHSNQKGDEETETKALKQGQPQQNDKVNNDTSPLPSMLPPPPPPSHASMPPPPPPPPPPLHPPPHGAPPFPPPLPPPPPPPHHQHLPPPLPPGHPPLTHSILPPPLASHLPPPPPPPPPLPPPSLPPPLPPPSESVKRALRKPKNNNNNNNSKKKNLLMADIWASQEEVQYEEYQSGISLEGESDVPVPDAAAPVYYHSHKKNRAQKAKEAQALDPCSTSSEGYTDYRHIPKNNAPPTVSSSTSTSTSTSTSKTTTITINPNEWYYKDNSEQQNIQGPFTSQQMMEWTQAGFFPPETPIRNGTHGLFSALQHIDFTATTMSCEPPSQPQPQPQPEKTEALDEVQARIAVLKQQQQSENVEIGPAPLPAAPSSNTVQDRIAALRQQHQNINAPPPLPPPPAPTAPLVSTNSVQDRINTLRQQRIKEEEEEQQQQLMNQNQNENGVAARIASLKQQQTDPNINHTPSNNDTDVAYPTLEAYPIEDNDESEAAYPAVGDYPAVGAYPIDDADGDYPAVGAYPVDDDDGAADYPAVGAYPIDDDNDAGGDYPAVGAYPIDDAYPAHYNHIPVPSPIPVPEPPKKKVFQGDKTVLKGLIPSNLQQRRPAPARKKRKLQGNSSCISSFVLSENDGAVGAAASKSSYQDMTKKPSPSDSEQPQQPKSNSVADDYDKFMEEIAALK